jgi:hypothetical protein
MNTVTWIAPLLVLLAILAALGGRSPRRAVDLALAAAFVTLAGYLRRRQRGLAGKRL